MEQLQMETFLGQKKTTDQNDSMCTRFIRKKFRCIILFMLTIIVLSQLLIILFEKIDEKYVNKILEVVTSNKSTSLLASLVRSVEEEG